MIIGVPKEIKTRETRVAVTPEGVRGLVSKGHRVVVEKEAGLLSGFADGEYAAAGASIEASAEKVWKGANLVVKVKEPLENEYRFFRPDVTLFTYLHLAGVPELAKALCASKMTAIGYETVEAGDGSLPLLRPMSEVAGRVGAQIGSYLLHKDHGGKGLLLGGVTGTRRGTVVVLGGGWVGINAAEIAVGLRAETVLLEINDRKLAWIEENYKGNIRAVKSSPQTIEEWVPKADLLVGAVLVAGDRAPHLVSEALVKRMAPGSVIVDIAIDQGGCIETIRATSHDRPTYVQHGVIHYAVPNMPALVPHTSTEALTTATFPYVAKLADAGVEGALAANPLLGKGLQTKDGKIVLPVLAKLFPDLA